MISNIQFSEFYSKHYEIVQKTFGIVLKNYVKTYGNINRYIDIALLKDMVISKSMEQVYKNYNDRKDGAACFKTYMYKVVHNTFITEIGKQWTEVKRNHPELIKVKDKVRESMRYRQFITNARFLCNNEGKKELYNYMDSVGIHERKEDVLENLKECIKKLSFRDQIIVECWMSEKRNYADKALDRLGIPIGTKSQVMIRRRLDLIKTKLANMMGGAKPDYRDI